MAPITPTVIRKPLLSIQNDWDEVLREKIGSVWVSCKEYGKNSKHGKLNVIPCESTCVTVEGSDGFRVQKITAKSLSLSHEDPNCRCDFYAPSKIFSNIHLKNVLCLDVTNAGLGASVSGDNTIYIWDNSNGSVLRKLEGHIWDVYSCRFFPSGIVVLSGGADMQLKIWAADTGQCPVTLTGHSAAVTDTAVVDRGRNIVSVSKDGTARLWDCGKATCLDVLSRSNGSINCSAVAEVDIDVGTPENPPSEREVATDGKLLVFGCENGNLKGVGLQSRKQIFEHNCGSAINCCCFTSKSTLAFGTQDGRLYLFDLRARLPVTVWEESTSPVLCLLSIKNGLLCGRGDGSCIFNALDKDQCVQLTGPGFDPVYCMAANENAIFTGARDGLIRKYDLNF
ncbi:proteasomal ATPase-associated factor 1-like [Uloborus diversus]|uniref:proteasomal ATPase-associated factor 1-like n=1 Tax=Uloborus diversus TaxID=327109 RepID=UPI0024093F3E|nr:proteasomal ATPase-associated factor 1-like [Uloborus diversus]